MISGGIISILDDGIPYTEHILSVLSMSEESTDAIKDEDHLILAKQFDTQSCNCE